MSVKEITKLLKILADPKNWFKLKAMDPLSSDEKNYTIIAWVGDEEEIPPPILAINVLEMIRDITPSDPQSISDKNPETIEFESLGDEVSISIDSLDLPIRIHNLCKRLGIKTVDDLVKFSEIDLLGHRNFGERSLKALKEILIKLPGKPSLRSILSFWSDDEIKNLHIYNLRRYCRDNGLDDSGNRAALLVILSENELANRLLVHKSKNILRESLRQVGYSEIQAKRFIKADELVGISPEDGLAYPVRPEISDRVEVAENIKKGQRCYISPEDGKLHPTMKD